MKAIVKYGRFDGAVEVREIAEPELTPGTVLIRPRAVGVCGSDIHMWREHQSWEVKDDLVLGHEAAGIVAAVGKDVRDWQVGDEVVMETAAQICGVCVYCRGGNYNLCPGRLGYGALFDGSMAEVVPAEPRVLHRKPESVPFEHAAMTEPYCVAFNGLVERGSVKPGDVVVVQGVGPIGSVSIQIARLRGAGTVVALGTSADAARLERAKTLGADLTIDITQEDPVEVLAALGDGYGADVVVDATGVSAALGQSMRLVRPLGSIVKIGWGPQPFGESLDPMVEKAVTLYGCFSHTWKTWERVLTLFASKRIDPGTIIGGSYAIEEWEEGFRLMEFGNNTKSVISLS